MSQSIDSMLGIINNANQTSTILESQHNNMDALRNANERNMLANLANSSTIISEQRNNTDNIKASNDRNLINILDNIKNGTQRTDDLINMNNNFANQNLTSVSSGLKDLIQNSSINNLSATERNGANAISATDRVGNLLNHSIERIGGDSINATERNGSANLVASERIGGTLANIANQNNSILMNGIKETQITSERNFGETRLFNSSGFQNLERRVGDYYVQSEKNFGRVETDLARVENSIGRLVDNHHSTNMIELLKTHAALDKSIDRSEHAITRQASDYYANIQIEAAKNKSSIEQKISDISNDIKFSILKDNNDTRSLINSYNNDNIRHDLTAERVMHAIHHCHNRHHDNHYHDHHRDHHGSHFFPYPNYLQQNFNNHHDWRGNDRRDGDGGGGRGGGEGGRN